MSEPMSTGAQSLIVGTSIATFFTGFLLGVYSIRAYLISPDLAEERKHNLYDPLESEESYIDEDDTVLDHAPNWSNGADADRRQGLSASAKAPVKEGCDAGADYDGLGGGGHWFGHFGRLGYLP